MTRTIPVSGKYNDRQRSIQCRSKSKNEATKMLTRNALETIPYRSR
jgi:hypothetical protein